MSVIQKPLIMLALFKFALVLCLCHALVAVGQDESFLDLTKVHPVPERKTGGGDFNVSGGNDTRSPTLPIQITLFGLNEARYQMGDEVLYDVVITNVGRRDVVIPWSPYEDEIKPDANYPPGYLVGSFGLVINDLVLGEQTIYGPVLYGSDRVPSSLKRLRSGQKVTIHIPSRWLLTGDDAAHKILTRLPQKYAVRARFSLIDRTVNPPRPVISANSVTVELNKKSQEF
jgi:hypothetical protein